MSEPFDPRLYRVALLAGGTSGEREISLASGKGALTALTEAGFHVKQFDPASKEDLKALIDGDYDVAFLCMHGRKGEDGSLQGFLELIELPYTGSGVWSSSTAMDKTKSKVFYKLADIPTPSSVTLSKGELYDIDQLVSKVGPHCVVKPATEGSSLGVFIVDTREALAQALEEAFSYDTQVLVEQYVQGTELTVAVIGNEDAHALPIIEIIPQSDSYDFDSKYAPGGSQHICPAPLSDEVAERIQSYAVQAHHALDCAGMSRSDFILDENGESWILETNTIPGMTGTSLLPDAARAAGMSFAELCTHLIKNALKNVSRETI